MKNKNLAHDYLTRAGHRLEAVGLLLKRQSYADVVRESQELVELCLKGLLRYTGIEVPRTHDVGQVLTEFSHQLPKTIQAQAKKLAAVSKSLRRDRELAFYGTEDLTPSEFYLEADAVQAYQDAKWVYAVCRETVL